MNTRSALTTSKAIFPSTGRVLKRRNFSTRHRLRSNQPENGGSGSSKAQERMGRLNARLPRFLRRFTTPILHAPVSHITSFLILHEITAIAPLFSLFAFFHYANWLPPYVSEGKLFKDGMDKLGRYFRKKGWLGEEGSWRTRRWGLGESGVRILVEAATAYAITKALLPARLLLSAWATPWFARVAILPLTSRFRLRFWGRKSAATASGAAGTGAVGARAVPKKTASGSHAATKE